ncbi:MAG: ribosome small subunit-dependent GTPase A [Planctomycetota bacterium]
MTRPAPKPGAYEFDAAAVGWRPFFANQCRDHESGFTPARVCRVQARRCHVWSARHPLGTHALPIQLFGDEGLPAVGDWLLLDPRREQPPRRLERFSALTRQAPGSGFAVQTLAANVDTLCIVTSCNQDFNTGRIERYLALAAEAGTRPVLLLTKADLAGDPERFVAQARALDDGLQIETLDARDPDQLAPVRELCATGQTVAALGSSGVGKSTLVNVLTGADQAVGAVRGDDNKGKHTTTSRSLHRVPAGGVIIDLPGIRELQLAEAAAGIDDTFAEIFALVAECRFSNCTHTQEPGCAVTAALAAGRLEPRRWDNYRKLQSEQKAYADSKAARDKRAERKNLERKKTSRRRLEEDD